MIGMVVGVAIFAAGYTTFAPWMEWGAIDAARLPELLGVSEPLLLVLFAAAAATLFWWGHRVEQAHGGALTAEALQDR